MASAPATGLYLYGATNQDLVAALWIAENQGVPTANVTGELDVANGWVSSSLPTIAVGGPALNNLMGESSSYVDFCSYQSWYNTPAQGPINGCGATGLDSWKLGLAQVEAAIAGSLPSDYTSVTPCTYNGVACT